MKKLWENQGGAPSKSLISQLLSLSPTGPKIESEYDQEIPQLQTAD